ncbi:hypothetical protein ACLE20_15160 [Rhizobium sp. YIM 134829]
MDRSTLVILTIHVVGFLIAPLVAPKASKAEGSIGEGRNCKE